MSKKSKATRTYRDRGTDTPEAPLGVVDIDTAESAAKFEHAELVPIFRIDGKTYSMRKVERADIALRYLDIIQTEGEDQAAAYLLTETLGDEALSALGRVVGLSGKQFNAVMKSVRQIALPKDRGRK